MQHNSAHRPADLKHKNKSAILRFVYRHRKTTKPEITKAIGLSKPAASSLVDELVEGGLLKPVGMGTSTTQGGKPPILYSFNHQYGGILSLSVDVEAIECVLFNLGMQTLTRRKHRYIDGTINEILSSIASVISKMLNEAVEIGCPVVGIGISLPGIVSAQGTLINAIHLQGWKDIALGVYLSRQFGLPVWLDNECRNMTLAEHWFGIGKGLRSFITIKTKDGLGTGIMLDGSVYQGMDNSGGEFGHTTIDINGPVCHCGNHGCWELYASEDGFLKLVGDEVFKGLPLSFEKVSEERFFKEGRTFSDLGQFYKTGDERVDKIVERYAFYLGVGIVNLVNTFNPQVIILPKDLSVLGNPFLDAIQTVVRERALPQPAQRVVIKFSELGEDATIIGAATLVLRNIIENNFLLSEVNRINKTHEKLEFH